MGVRDGKVDEFVSRAGKWRGELQKLRGILRDCGLEEELKWGKPCFTVDGRNVAILQPFKEHCSLMFFKGALLEDTHGLLRSQGKNTQSAKRLEFRSEREITKAALRSYVKQAIAVEKAGLTVAFPAKHDLELPEELTRAFARSRKLEKAFAALTPGRRRAYVLHFTGAKQSATRAARVARCVPGILAGRGIDGR